MRSLFLKIFLWFGLALLLVNLGLFVMFLLTAPRNRPLRGPSAAALGIYAQTAADTFERDGKSGLSDYLSRVESASGVRAVVFNENGEELSGRAAPMGARELASKASQSTRPNFSATERDLAAFMARSASGRPYTLVAGMPGPPPPPPGPFGLEMGRSVQHLLLALFIGAALCYWLARYLTAPIVKLRATTRELADGNFNARVGPELTRQKDEIGHLGRDFNLMAERIESLVMAERRLLADISHELRSPLARQRVAIAIARRRATPEAASAIDRIESEAESVNEMLSQVLTLSRFESGTDGLRTTAIDLPALLEKVADDADFEAKGRDRSVRVTESEPCATTGVFELLRSAVENVVRNAVHYTAEGTEVELALRCEGGEAEKYAVIRVRDHGAGVPDEAIEKIFRPFYRVEDARDRETGGTGLGLAIAARAVRLHGGTIQAANAPDGGLMVEIRLPIKLPIKLNF
ncbi:MAG TPA: ATP-binding protein [Pyrinomonadaceae bacterium]|nr:ATP-binding protein [Pyrinomonadaceae bacterium]